MDVKPTFVMNHFKLKFHRANKLEEGSFQYRPAHIHTNTSSSLSDSNLHLHCHPSHFLATVLLLDIQRAFIAMATTEAVCADDQPQVILSARLSVCLYVGSALCQRWAKLTLLWRGWKPRVPHLLQLRQKNDRMKRLQLCTIDWCPNEMFCKLICLTTYQANKKICKKKMLETFCDPACVSRSPV